jgi:dethiobiotin synthetase
VISSPRFAAALVGTDTGVGKTAVGVALLRLAHRRGLRAVPFKPAETGCTFPDETDHARLLSASCNPALTVEDVCPHRFAPPVAPSIAAAAAGVDLSPPALLPFARRLAANADLFLLETAGGLLAPYAPGSTGADLVAALALPALLISRNGLGTINHTALTVAELRRRQIPIAAIILVDTVGMETPDRPHNARLIHELTGIRPVATLPFVARPTPDALADALQAQIAPEALLDLIAVPPA